MKLVPGDLRRLVQEQGRAAAAGRRGRLPAVAARHPADDRGQPGDRRARDAARPSTTAPFSALAFKIMNDQHVGQLVFVRVYSGTLEAGLRRVQLDAGEEGAGRPPAPDARQQARRDRAVVGRRHRGGDRPQADARTGDTLCDPRQADRAGVDGLPGARSSRWPSSRRPRPTRRSSGLSLARLALEDPTFKVNVDAETNQTLIHGMGELHLEIIVDRLLREFKVEANVGKPQVAYRETDPPKAEAQGGSCARRAAAASTATCRSRSSRTSRARASCSRTRSRVRLDPARVRARPSRRASRKRWRPACSPAIRWWTSRSR